MRPDAYQGTAAMVQTALGRSFQALPPEGAAWRGLAGPRASEVAAHVIDLDGRPGVRVEAVALPAPGLDAAVAGACVRENDPVVFGRFLHRDGAIRAEHTILGGPTMHVDEVRVAVWAVGWAAGAFRGRLERRLDGSDAREPLPLPRVEPRRGAEDRVRFAEEKTERLLRARYGGFERDEHWGYHGGFGSARVFVSVRHYLESSTAVVVASPVLLDVDASPALLLDAHGLMAREPFGRFAWVEQARQLWYEHAVLGDDLDADELYAAIDEVARVADGEDDRLAAAHGGCRYADV